MNAASITGRIPRWWSRVLDGKRVWGSVVVSHSRYGITRCLVVFPPGIGQDDRRRLRVWRGWPLWGVALWLALEIGLSHLLTPWAAIATSTFVSLAAGGIARYSVNDDPSRVRSLSLVTMSRYTDPLDAAKRAEFEFLASLLMQADAMREDGKISPVEYEAVWWHVYDRLAPDRSVFIDAQRTEGAK